MLAWGLPSGVGGACENTLIPEWRCPVKRLTHRTGQSGAACLNVPTSICDLHPPHITLYQAHYPTNSIEKVQAGLAEITKKVPQFEITMHNFSVLNGFIFYDAI